MHSSRSTQGLLLSTAGFTVAWWPFGKAATRRPVAGNQRSPDWQILERFWRWQSRWLPLNSWRGRLWLFGPRTGRWLLRAGPLPLALPAPTPTETAPALPAPAAAAAPRDANIRYERWIHQSEALLYNRARTERVMTTFTRWPRISVILPVYNTPADCLSAAIESVLAQYYPHWELCICDDASTAPHIRHILTGYAAQDRASRSRSVRAALVSVCTSQRALELATGDYVAFLDHDDTLAPDAFYAFAAALQEGDADLLYSDLDLLDPAGRRYSPCHKPGWSLDLFLSCMYTC